MMIQIHCQGFDAGESLKAHIRTHIRAATRPFAEHVSRVDAYLKDLNGPRGGDDKAVRVEARLLHRPSVHVNVERGDFYAAGIVAGRLLKRAVRRDLKRQLRLSRRGGNWSTADGIQMA